MKNYQIGEIFYEDDDIPQIAKFCNENHLRIVDITKKEDSKRSFTIEKVPEPSEESLLKIFRNRRKEECFSVINQNFIVEGKSLTWFDTLTEKQKIEAGEWIKAWRDVTITKIIPVKPKWMV